MYEHSIFVSFEASPYRVFTRLNDHPSRELAAKHLATNKAYPAEVEDVVIDLIVFERVSPMINTEQYKICFHTTYDEDIYQFHMITEPVTFIC